MRHVPLEPLSGRVFPVWPVVVSCVAGSCPPLCCVCLSRRAPVCTSGIYLLPSAVVSCDHAGLGSSWEGRWLATHSQWPLWELPLQKSPDCSLGGIKGLAPHPAQDKPGELSGLQRSLWGPLAAQCLCLSVLLPCFPSPCWEVIRAALPGKPSSTAALCITGCSRGTWPVTPP